MNALRREYPTKLKPNDPILNITEKDKQAILNKRKTPIQIQQEKRAILNKRLLYTGKTSPFKGGKRTTQRNRRNNRTNKNKRKTRRRN